MCPRGRKERALIEELFRGNNWHEELVQASPTDENAVRCIIKEDFFVCPEFTIKSINTVRNSFLEAMYLMKKAEIKSKLNIEPTEKPLIHCTSESVANIVAKDNFNWRKVKRAKYGNGISFSNDASYADKYANDKIGNHRAFIISKVLVTRSVVGEEEQDLPENGYDTTNSLNGKVYVKYSDNEVLPLYIVFYTSLKARPRKFGNAIGNAKSGQDNKYTPNRYRLQGTSTRAYGKRPTNNPHKLRDPKRVIRHVSGVKQNHRVTQPGFSMDIQDREQFIPERIPRSAQSRTRSAFFSLFKWTMFTIISVTISLLLFHITKRMF